MIGCVIDMISEQEAVKTSLSDSRATFVLVLVRDPSVLSMINVEPLWREIRIKHLKESVYFIESAMAPRDVERFANNLVKSFYAMISRMYFRADDLMNVLTKYESEFDDTLIVKSMVAKRWFGKKETMFTYFVGRLDEAIRKARTHGVWIDYIKVSSTKRDFTFSINRRGVIRLNSTVFFNVIRYIMDQLSDIFMKRYALFTGRSRLETKSIKPLIIEFSEPIFKDINNTKKFLKILEEYQHAYYFVIHNGNPYVYITLTDKLDGSSYSIRTYKENSIVIIPQLKTTPSSLVRITEYILKKVGEGEIKDYKV